MFTHGAVSELPTATTCWCTSLLSSHACVIFDFFLSPITANFFLAAPVPVCVPPARLRDITATIRQTDMLAIAAHPYPVQVPRRHRPPEICTVTSRG